MKRRVRTHDQKNCLFKNWKITVNKILLIYARQTNFSFSRFSPNFSLLYDFLGRNFYINKNITESTLNVVKLSRRWCSRRLTPKNAIYNSRTVGKTTGLITFRRSNSIRVYTNVYRTILDLVSATEKNYCSRNSL